MSVCMTRDKWEMLLSKIWKITYRVSLILNDYKFHWLFSEIFQQRETLQKHQCLLDKKQPTSSETTKYKQKWQKTSDKNSHNSAI